MNLPDRRQNLHSYSDCCRKRKALFWSLTTQVSQVLALNEESERFYRFYISDTVYHCGDVVIGKKHLEKIRRLNGKKKLIMGNHDIFKIPSYQEAGFYDFVAYRVFVDEFVLSHMPIHMGSVSDRFIANVHGHLHGKRVMKIKHVQGHDIIYSDTEIDPRYYSVCVEQINYTPISHEDLKASVLQQFEDCGYKRPTKAGFGNGSNPG